MKPVFLVFCGALSGLFSAQPSAHAQEIYRTYNNARFGTSVRYPAHLVAPQPESDNGDGRKFLSSDGQVELTVYGFNNAMNRSASAEMRRAIADWKRDGARLTYYRASRDWFVLSGYLGADIFYEKTLLRRGVFHTLIWQYPKSLKKSLDAGVSRSASSFSATAVSQNSAQSAPQPTTTQPTTTQSTTRPRASKSQSRSTPRTVGGY